MIILTNDSTENLKPLAWWLPWNMQEYLPRLAKVNIHIEGIHFTDPVMLEPLTGEVSNIKIENQGKGILIKEAPLADYPMIVVERETINVK